MQNESQANLLRLACFGQIFAPASKLSAFPMRARLSPQAPTFTRTNNTGQLTAITDAVGSLSFALNISAAMLALGAVLSAFQKRVAQKTSP